MKRLGHTVFAVLAICSISLFALAGFLPRDMKILTGIVAACGMGLSALLGIVGALLTEYAE